MLNNSIVGDYKYLGKSIIELRFDIGAGYRIYATQIESELIVLLAGGTKSRQQADIEKAKKIPKNGGKNMKATFKEWDVVDHLGTEEDIAAYLNAALEEDDPKLLQAVLGDIARARGMTDVAKSIGVGRESLYKSLSTEGNPSFQTIMKLLFVLGLKMEFVPAKAK